MATQKEKGEVFRDLHRPGDPFVLPNPWDVGSAKLLAAAGAKAVATTSAGHAWTLGRLDGGRVTREEALAHAADIAAAVDLPVSGDLEWGYGEAPETVAETVRLAAEAGLVGCTIEDIAPPNGAAVAFDLAVARIEAAVAAARALPFPFTLCARADGVLARAYDPAEARRRLRAFEAAGADAIYAPFLPFDDLAALCAESRAPVNALSAGPLAGRTRAELAAIGVARISTGGGLARVALGAAMGAATAMLEDGDFSGLGGGIETALLARALGD